LLTPAHLEQDSMSLAFWGASQALEEESFRSANVGL